MNLSRFNYFKKKTSQLSKLQNMPRFKNGVFHSREFAIEYTDSLSFYHEYNDIFKNRIYHFSTTKKEPTIIDAGGYIGLSTLYFKSIYPDAKITIFEPDKKIFETLKKNIVKNNLSNITAVNLGLGSEEKKVRFYPDNADGGSIYGDTNNFTEIELTKLSKYINKEIDLLKMNIEGAEWEAFEETKEKLNMINEIIFEYHAFSDLPQTLGKILQLLDENGFRYLVTDAISAKIPVPFKLQPNYKNFNLVYAKKMS
jgi:FkbM family methyltransferase